MSDFGLSISSLKTLVGSARAPIIFDVRRHDAFAAGQQILPTARWREHTQTEEWARRLPADAHVVCYCVHGHGVSQAATAMLRATGIDAQFLVGGIEGWIEAGGVTISKPALVRHDEDQPSRWVTRVQPKIDRIACPWLINRFIDREAEFLFSEPAYVESIAAELGAIPFDVEGVELSHVGETCTFDTLLKHFAINDPALVGLAAIVRGADTARLELAPAAAGLIGISLGISVLSDGDDHAALARGFDVYDALYAWQRFALDETHNWPVQEVAS